eukprot:131660-Ditylum_brightwellii.AAC.1
MTVLKEIGAALIGGVEVNLNWRQQGKYEKARDKIQQVWSKHKFITSNCKERTTTDFQPGRTFTIATDK